MALDHRHRLTVRVSSLVRATVNLPFHPLVCKLIRGTATSLNNIKDSSPCMVRALGADTLCQVVRSPMSPSRKMACTNHQTLSKTRPMDQEACQPTCSEAVCRVISSRSSRAITSRLARKGSLPTTPNLPLNQE